MTVTPETVLVPTTVLPVIKGDNIFVPPVMMAPDIVSLPSITPVTVKSSVIITSSVTF